MPQLTHPLALQITVSSDKIGLSTLFTPEGILVFKGKRKYGYDETDYTNHSVLAIDGQAIKSFGIETIEHFAAVVETMPRPFEIVTVCNEGGGKVARRVFKKAAREFKSKLRKPEEKKEPEVKKKEPEVIEMLDDSEEEEEKKMVDVVDSLDGEEIV